MAFKRLTPQQRAALRALRALGEMVVTPQDARPLRALQARGLCRYARRDGVRVVILRLTRREQRAYEKARYLSIPAHLVPVWYAARLQAKLNKDRT